MITISGQPILETILTQLKETGIDEVWIVVNHHMSIIQEHFKYGKSLGLKIDYIHQTEEKGIGHAVSLCESVIGNDDHFLLIYGDCILLCYMQCNYMRRLSIPPLPRWGFKPSASHL